MIICHTLALLGLPLGRATLEKAPTHAFHGHEAPALSVFDQSRDGGAASFGCLEIETCRLHVDFVQPQAEHSL